MATSPLKWLDEAGRGHGFPVLSSDCKDLLPIGLETLEGAKGDVGVLFPDLLELTYAKCSLLEIFGASAREVSAF